jgi:hypothetical protein
MKMNNAWLPSILLQSPLFKPVQPALTHLQGKAFPGPDEWNELRSLHCPAITVSNGLPLRFVPQATGRQGFESQYEPRCYLTGEVQTRSDNWHDFFNALVWLTFPKAKAAINSRHYQALLRAQQPGESQRGKVRDMATLFDESGVIVACANAELAELLCTFQWKELFWRRRELVGREMGFYIFGHGLYEKALQPYVGMTGQGLVVHVSEAFFGGTLQEQTRYLDERVAAYLNDPAHCVSTRELQPVPLLGMPGWAIENSTEAYYDNTAYFRPGRQWSR